MLYPPMSELLKHIPSRYLLVNVVARRARQIAIEAESSGVALEDKPVTLALSGRTWGPPMAAGLPPEMGCSKGGGAIFDCKDCCFCGGLRH